MSSLTVHSNSASRIERLERFLKTVQSAKDRTKIFQTLDSKDRISIVGSKTMACKKAIQWDAIGKKTLVGRVQGLIKTASKKRSSSTESVPSKHLPSVKPHKTSKNKATTISQASKSPRQKSLEVFLEAVQSANKAYRGLDSQDRMKIFAARMIANGETIKCWDALGMKGLEGCVQGMIKTASPTPPSTKLVAAKHLPHVKPGSASKDRTTISQAIATPRQKRLERLEGFLKLVQSAKDAKQAFRMLDEKDRTRLSSAQWATIGRQALEKCVRGLIKEAATVERDLAKRSSQYDIKPSSNDPKGLKPPACGFHALHAMAAIAKHFDKWVRLIEAGKVDDLSKLQRAIIERGLDSYNKGLKHQPGQKFEKGADLVHLRGLAKELGLQFSERNQDLDAVPKRVEQMVDQLADSQTKKRVIWIKLPTEVTFAVICFQGKAIVFDSHENKISLFLREDQLKSSLRAKLSPYAHILADGTDANASDYSVGYYRG